MVTTTHIRYWTRKHGRALLGNIFKGSYCAHDKKRIRSCVNRGQDEVTPRIGRGAGESFQWQSSRYSPVIRLTHVYHPHFRVFYDIFRFLITDFFSRSSYQNGRYILCISPKHPGTHCLVKLILSV